MKKHNICISFFLHTIFCHTMINVIDTSIVHFACNIFAPTFMCCKLMVVNSSLTQLGSIAFRPVQSIRKYLRKYWKFIERIWKLIEHISWKVFTDILRCIVYFQTFQFVLFETVWNLCFDILHVTSFCLRPTDPTLSAGQGPRGFQSGVFNVAWNGLGSTWIDLDR